VAPEFDWELADAEPKAKLVAHIARMIKKLESLDKRRESKAVARTALEKPRNYTVRDLFEDRPEDIEIDGFKMSLRADNENLVRYAMTTYAEGTTSLTILDTLNDNMFRVMIEGSFTSGLRWKNVCRGNTQVSAVLKATFSKQAAARVALEDNEIRSLDDFPDTFRILGQDFSANSRSGKLVYKSKARTIVVFAYGAGKGVLITDSLGLGKTLDSQ
jgi:hypothetical protein